MAPFEPFETRARPRRRRVRRTRFAGPGAAGARLGGGARRPDRRADRRPWRCGRSRRRKRRRRAALLGRHGIDGRDPALGRGQAAHRPAGGGARRRATGCCARPAAGAASSICWSRITPTTRPRRWPCAPPGRAGPTGSPAWRRLVELPEVRLLRPLLGVSAGAAHRDAARARRAVDRRSFQRRPALRAGAAARGRPRRAPAADSGGVRRRRATALGRGRGRDRWRSTPAGRASPSTGRPSSRLGRGPAGAGC